MDSFEQVGINFQYDARSIEDANKKFEYSCDCCCNKGRNKPCDQCKIAIAHRFIVAFFNDQKTNNQKT